MAEAEDFCRLKLSPRPAIRYDFVSVSKDNKEAAVAELEAAYKIIELEEKSFSYGISLFVFSVTAIVGLLSLQSTRLDEFVAGVGELEFYIICYIAILAVCFILASVFADRCKVIALNLRKIVVFRARFGLNYRDFHWIIPAGRFEGASNPFYVPIFPGWFSYRVMPIHVVGIICFFAFLFLNQKIFVILFSVNIIALSAGLSFVQVCFLYLIFRLKLRDSIESIYIMIAAIIGRFVGPKLKNSPQNVMYESDFSAKEVERLHINLQNLRKMAVLLEDKRFFRHRGWDYAAVIRAVWARLTKGKRSGASTITQQFARSLFLTDLSPRVSRKLLEILIAKGLERRLSKRQILDCYLCGVRFAHGQIGVAAALQHFFPSADLHVRNIGRAPAFFLIERISNIKDDLLVNKIVSQLRDLSLRGELSRADIRNILEIYQIQIRHGRIVPSDEQAMKKLADAVRDITDGEFTPWSPDHRA